MNTYLHPRIELLFSLIGGLDAAARELSKAARKRAENRRPRQARGATLRPGTETELWNALSTAIRPHLNQRGARAVLARELGVHRARIGEYFDQGTAMPDAQRTLQLLLWLNRRLQATSPETPTTNVRNTNIRRST